MKIAFKRLCFYLFVSVEFIGCTTGSRPVLVSLDPKLPVQPSDGGIARQFEQLSNFVKKNPADAEEIADVLQMLRALSAEALGDREQAVKAWLAALESAKGSFGERAFSGWLKAFAKNLGGKKNRRELARLVLAETRGGSVGPWMLDRGLQSEDKLLPIIQKEAADYIEGEVIADDAKIAPPTEPGISAADPLLVKLAADVCRYKSQYADGWENWRRSIKADITKYFDALVKQCSGQSSKALQILADVAPRLASNTSTAPLALESYARMIKMRREQGERESVAPLYIPFMQLWRNPAVNETTLGLSRSVFEQRRIDDTLWAARSRASIGDGESAKTFAEDVLNYVSAALMQSYTLSSEQKNSLVASAAETYHILAFRLAVESRDWDKSYNIAELALNQPGLADEWRFRFRWSQGLYRYLAEDYDQARKIWEQLLTDSTDDRMRPALLFWVSQAHSKLGNSSESSFYRKSLAEDYPISFYSVTALSLTNGPFGNAWQNAFKNLQDLRESLAEWQKVNIDDLRSDRQRGRLLRRAEILTSLDIERFSGMALDELQKSFDSATGGDREAEWGLYVSRLYAASGNWLGAISLTTKLSKNPDFWRQRPEQFLAYFPRPYLPAYKAIGHDMNIDPNVLLGISRQESSFRPDIKSGANAWGVMQLMPFTAKRLLPDAGFPNPASIQLPDELIRPEVNIRLGASLVRELSARFAGSTPQVYAAYNAGTQTVDTWIARRLFDDPLIFIEMIPYQETRDYVKGVWRNQMVYEYIATHLKD